MQSIELEPGVPLQLVRIPAGKFVMGDATGYPDEQPASVVTIAKPFWMGQYEVTNEQFRCFDAQHDSHVEPMHGYQFGIRGYPVHQPRQPVVRVSWNKAIGFCYWLSQRTGRRFALPSDTSA